MVKCHFNYEAPKFEEGVITEQVYCETELTEEEMERLKASYEKMRKKLNRKPFMDEDEEISDIYEKILEYAIEGEAEQGRYEEGEDIEIEYIGYPDEVINEDKKER